jgi:hemerythrin
LKAAGMNDSNGRHILGLPEMDEQHRYLYRLFDLIGNDRSVADRDRMESLLVELQRYLNFHFTSEENLMRSYNYSGFGGHQSDHEIAANRFVQFTDDFETGLMNPAALRIFLTGWLMEHSRTADADYTAWIFKCRAAAGIIAE